ncbi:MAG: DUF6716 putative glycosyltransferase [Cyanobacteriota bacterium]|nr:DUF6716 putative glycosyltransferase [Cyanobacteriota bacterium]
MRVLLISSPGQPHLAALALATRLRAAGAEVVLAGGAGSDLPIDPELLLTTDLARQVQALGLLVEARRLPALLPIYRQACRLAGVAGAPVFSGPCEPLSGDRLSADLLHRLEVDLLCLHGPGEAEEWADLVRGTPWADRPMVQLGLWQRPTGGAGAGRPRTAVFLEQGGIPAGPSGKEPLLRLLSRLAAASPGWTVLIQPTPPALATAAPEVSGDLGDLIRRQHHPRPPANLIPLELGQLEAALRSAAVCLSISSPWVFHGLALGRRCLLMGDYGIRTDTNLPLFFGSRLIHRLSEVTSLDRLPRCPGPHPRWLGRLGWEIEDPAAALLGALARLPAP